MDKVAGLLVVVAKLLGIGKEGSQPALTKSRSAIDSKIKPGSMSHGSSSKVPKFYAP